MKSNNKSFSYDQSKVRIDDILKTDNKSYEEVDSIPSRDKLTFNNGFYVNKTSVVYVDIRNSSKLPEDNQRPVLAKIYRAFISEVVAVLNSDENCAEVSIDGDCVWGIYNTPYTSDINEVFSTAAVVSSVIELLNCKFKKKSIKSISVGIGISFGRVLMIKAGYQGSSLNDVVWMGEAVNDASKLCSFGNKSFGDKQMMVSSNFYGNLNDHNKALLGWNSNRGCYHGHVINTYMDNKLVEDKCK